MMRAKLLLGLLLTSVLSLLAPPTHAADGAFALQISPSPLVATVKPGVASDLELRIRNAGSDSETLKIEARKFIFNDQTGTITLDDKTAPDIAPWLSFSATQFSINAGEWYTQKVHIALPSSAGFSYAFALIVSRKDAPTISGGRLLKGSAAVFSLVNVDRPGATRSVDLVSFAPEHKLYEYLPATLNVRLKNSGNTIVQPYGNIFIQRSSGDKNSLATLPVNDSRAYLLPGTERTLSTAWADGFPVYSLGTDSSGQPQKTLDWNLDHLRQIRFGRYTAKVVAVYNDGTRDVPITGEVTFWVIPWRILLGLLVIIIIIILGLRLLIRARTKRAVAKALKRRSDT